MVKKHKKGFTLVELLAVIVILAIILVIAVPQIMKTIDEARKGALGSSAKLIAASAEREYLARKTIGDTDFNPANVVMECSEVAETTSDYTDCSIKFDENGKATVKLKGQGKFKGKYVCNGTREEALVTEEECGLVALTVDPNGGTNTVEYNAKYVSGSTVTLTIPTAPSDDEEFDYWQVTVGADKGASVTGNTLTMGTEATTVKAMWKMSLPANANDYIENLYEISATTHGLSNPKVTNGEDEYNTGIRYTGSDPNNYVWFNCNPTDANGVAYGNENYTYDTTSCEKWRIIGVFDVEGTERVKIINTSSTFKASWDSSASTVNKGYGINQWGATSTYEGADLMRLLNGYYIETNDDTIAEANKSACTYCTTNGQSSCSATTNCSLLKPLTESALGMISSAKWYTYATNTSTAYLQERGISNTKTGKECTADEEYCSDSVTRENEWTGKVGLMYLSDVLYANGWLYNGTYFPWTISPGSSSSDANNVWVASSSSAYSYSAYRSFGVWPSVYLNSNVQITGTGENIGTTNNPYVLSA